MGRHVDTTRPEEWQYRYTPLADWERGLLGYDWPRVSHRKQGEAISRAGFAASQVEGYHAWRDAWSGNPDTNRAWR